MILHIVIHMLNFTIVSNPIEIDAATYGSQVKHIYKCVKCVQDRSLTIEQISV